MTDIDVDCFIDGKTVKTADTFEVIDPSTGKALAAVSRGGQDEIDLAVEAARRASKSWSRLSARERADHLRAVGAGIAAHAEELALLESHDTGKPLAQAQADAQVAIRYFDFYANAVEQFFGDVIPSMSDIIAYTRHMPFGVTGHIIPWNYPMQIACRTFVPALAVGNCAVVKPAEEAPLSVLRLARIAKEAGLPDGVLNVVPGFGAEAGAALASHTGISHLSFTGSVPIGAVIAKAAAANVIPVALELGGKSPNIVLADADLDLAIPVITKSIVQNAGQTCSAGSRLLVHSDVHEEVVDRVTEHLAALRIGDGPSNPDLGPLISEKQLGRVSELVKTAAQSTELRIGSSEPLSDRDGFFFGPALFDNVDPAATIAQDEVFGPVCAVSTFDDLDQAADIANGTEYGLIAAVWTSNINSAHRLADDIVAGQVYVNTYGAGGGVELPFGGFRKSGFGREKGFEALRAFCQSKAVVIKVAR
ncbi:aldehyde dehydrogenase family protein [Rhodococcoides fascians]|uniref:aldehyde dehydrogenase family protein n=1 Tax=Rhodococcoides fascians TaxID=1828 RepID=UPI00050C7705|nr:aldehyde dehydrogenase family protein [Rhodococcus fascians]